MIRVVCIILIRGAFGFSKRSTSLISRRLSESRLNSVGSRLIDVYDATVNIFKEKFIPEPENSVRREVVI